MKNCMLATCLFITICQCSSLWAEDPPSQLRVDISGWLRRTPRDDDSWKDRKDMPYEAVIRNATNNPDLLSFTTKLGRFKQAMAESDGPVDILESLVIESTTLTPEQARQLEAITTDSFTVLNCDISDEVARSLSSIRCRRSLRLEQLRMSDQSLISLARLESQSLSLTQLRLSDQALSTFLASKNLREVEAEEIRGCTADGWRGLSDRTSLSLKLSDCDFDDQALTHLSSSKCHRLQAKNTRLTGATLGSLKTQKDCLIDLILSGCPVNDQGLQTLPEFTKLQNLDLSGTVVTDQGFRDFKVSPDLFILNVSGTKVTQAWAIDISRRHQDSEERRLGALTVFFQDDPRWPPRGGYCKNGEFHLFK